MEKLQISLAAARVNAGLTQAEVAKIIHVSKQTIVNWEKGKNLPSFAVLNTLSALYQISMDDIFLPIEST